MRFKWRRTDTFPTVAAASSAAVTFADDLAESTELFWVYFAQGYNVNFTTPPHAFVRILDVPPGQ